MATSHSPRENGATRATGSHALWRLWSRRRRSTVSAARSGGCGRSTPRSSTASAPTLGFAATAIFAARIALWLSREYALVFGNDSAAGGWLARAERLLRDVAPGAEQGWLDLARSERTRDVEEAARLAGDALAVALEAGDTDLELRALAQLGFAEVSLGQVDVGLGHLDEAMAAATSGEPATLETFADVCCVLMLACERAGDSERPQHRRSRRAPPVDGRRLEGGAPRAARASRRLRGPRGQRARVPQRPSRRHFRGSYARLCRRECDLLGQSSLGP